eukprot:gene11497-4661_t
MEQSVEKFLTLYLEALENDKDVSKIEATEIIEEVEENKMENEKNIFQNIENREKIFEKNKIMNKIIPNKNIGFVDKYNSSGFCGKFSQDGSIFVTASQDKKIRIYDTNHVEYSMKYKNQTKVKREVIGNNVGYSILDIDISKNNENIIYSTWSNEIYLYSILKDKQYPIKLSNDTFAHFSIQLNPFKQNEILSGTSKGSIYLYDSIKNELMFELNAHENDINSVKYFDENIFLSGSDDATIRVWDKRCINESGKIIGTGSESGLGSESSNSSIGYFLGHTAGITCLSVSKNGWNFISNSKDQTLKLWDFRKMTSDKSKLKSCLNNFQWDYRYQECPMKFSRNTNSNDISVNTYVGHRILQTLIRCDFSPSLTTDENFIYTGSQDGSIYIYDKLTGRIIKKLCAHNNVVRDVCWHPTKDIIFSTSWDGSIINWNYQKE